MRPLAAASTLAALCAGCPAPPGPPRPREPPVSAGEASPWAARVGDVGVLQLAVPGWEDLTREERLLAYHLSLAAIAGDPIACDQHYDRNLEVQALLEGIVTRGEAVEPDVLARIREYLELFWIHHGVHDPATGAKTAPRFTLDELWSAALGAFAAGERFGLLDEADLRAALDDLAPVLFDPRRDPLLVVRTAPEDGDPLAVSASNFYGEGVSSGDLAGFREAHPLNSRIVRDDEGNLVEQVYRAGREEFPPGPYAPALRRVVRHLRDALPYAPEAQRPVLELVIDYLETGEPEAWRDWGEAWVAQDPAVDAVLGFVETNDDPRGVKGTWEGIVTVRDDARTARLRALAAASSRLLERVPWPDGPAAAPAGGEPQAPAAVETPTAAWVVVATGEAGLATPSAISLPNDPEVRRTAGAKGLWLANVDDAVRAACLEGAAREFACDEAEAAEAVRCGAAAWEAFAALHELLGHAPRPAGGAGDDAPAHDLLGEYAGAIAEARADLVALRLVEDPLLVELGFLPDAACGEALARDYVRGIMPALRAVAADEVTDDGLRAHLLVVRYAIERAAVAQDRRGARACLRIAGAPRWRAVLAELLGAVETARAEGDYEAARALVETYGARVPEGWRDEARRRALLAGLPSRFAFVPPALEPVRDRAGAIVDVRLVSPVALDALMLSWSAVATEE